MNKYEAIALQKLLPQRKQDFYNANVPGEDQQRYGESDL